MPQVLDRAFDSLAKRSEHYLFLESALVYRETVYNKQSGGFVGLMDDPRINRVDAPSLVNHGSSKGVLCGVMPHILPYSSFWRIFFM